MSGKARVLRQTLGSFGHVLPDEICLFKEHLTAGVTPQLQGGCGLSLRGVKSRVSRESTTSVVTGLRAGQFPIVPAGTPTLPTKIASLRSQ